MDGYLAVRMSIKQGTLKICGKIDVFYIALLHVNIVLKMTANILHVPIRDKRVCPSLNTINLWKNPSTALWNLCILRQKLKMVTEDGLMV